MKITKNNIGDYAVLANGILLEIMEVNYKDMYGVFSKEVIKTKFSWTGKNGWAEHTLDGVYYIDYDNSSDFDIKKIILKEDNPEYFL